ncbi:MAG: cytochrome C [Betaproteobacteria bacterium RBG_16_56_24]|nr:MAG: cytochrome C [Betaproteobacteria bacterium RBG_16_56_24]
MWLVIASLLAPSLAHAWPWSQDMANQVSIKPQESADEAKPGMKVFPRRSVPVAGTSVYVKDIEAATKMANPVPADAKSVDAGGRLYAIYCTPCHGQSGTGDGLVGAKLIMKPWNLTPSNEIHSWDPKEYPDGHIWGYITLGGAVMPGYANDLSANERWHVVNYVRKVLQGQAGQAAARAISTGSGQAK